MLRYVRLGVKRLYAAIALLSIQILVSVSVFSAALFAFIGIAKMIFKEKKKTLTGMHFIFLKIR